MNINILLVAGIVAGLGLALASILDATHGRLPGHAVARVNDSYIRRAAYERAVAAMDSDKRAPLTEEDRRHVLNRLIDEELLIQYGIRQGLVRNDREVKATLVQAVIQAKSLPSEVSVISDEAARDFFEANRVLFSRTERVRTGLIRVPATAGRSLEEARLRAIDAYGRLNKGEPFYEVAVAFHEGGVLNLPDTAMPRGKLVDYLGPSLADVATETEPGQAALPMQMGQAWQLVYVHERITAPPPAFDAVRDLVKTEMRRRDAEHALRKALEQMRRTEEIVIAEDLD